MPASLKSSHNVLPLEHLIPHTGMDIKGKTDVEDVMTDGIEKVKGKQTKRSRIDASGENTLNSRKMPKRAAACSDFKEKAVCLSEKDNLINTRRQPVVEDEIAAIGLTAGHDNPRPNRRLIDFIFHDEEGKAQPVEMLEVTDLFVSGVILPLELSGDTSTDNGVRCEGFGRIETWDISGYEDGAPTIWVSTELADYDCRKPAVSYKKIYGLFYEKARACIEVYKKLSRSSGGCPDITLDELLASLVRSMSGSKNFPPGASIKEFIISRGEFIYKQLIGLDDTSNKNDQKFIDLPVLVALRDECKQCMALSPDTMAPSVVATGGALKIRDGETKRESDASMLAAEDEDAKLARLLQEEEDWKSMSQRKGRRPTGSNKYYIKINEDEMAVDYPLPAYYKPNNEETDEYILFDNGMDIIDPDQLPRSMLHNWTLYNSDSRLVSLELLPMKPCDDIDVTIFGSGTVTDDDGSGFCLDNDLQSSSASSEMSDVGGIPIFLSAIKEWMIEIGASMVFISIRTDLAWYRLGKPSKQYAPWYETVLKTARLGVSIITLLKEQSRVARLSFSEIIKRLAEFGKDHPTFVSSNPTMLERYVVVHGQILLQQFAEFPDNTIRRCPFVTGLQDKMLVRHHTKWLVKKKPMTRKGVNLNPIAKMIPVAKRKLMPATTTRLINRIWGEFYSNYSPEESKAGSVTEQKEQAAQDDEEEDLEEDPEDEQQEEVSVQKSEKISQVSRPRKLHCSSEDIKWELKSTHQTSSRTFYKQATVHGVSVVVGGSVLVDTAEAEELPPIYLVEYMFENSSGRKMAHGRLMLRGCQTVLGTAANEREVFLTTNCFDFELGDVRESVVVEIRQKLWGYQYRKANALDDKIDRANAEDRKSKGLPLEYYCKSLYQPDRGAFYCLTKDSMGVGNGICHACKTKEAEEEKTTLKVNSSNTGFVYKGVEYNVDDFFYVAPCYLSEDEKGNETFKGGRNVGLKAYVICQLLEIEMPKASRKSDPQSTKIKVRKYFRPEDISAEKAYRTDIREVYFSEQIILLAIAAVQGKCEVRRKHDLSSLDYPVIYEHVFFCEHLYDHDSGAIKQLPSNVRLCSKVDSKLSKKKGKGKEVEDEVSAKENDSLKNRLTTLDIFAGCGGLSEGLEQSGVSQTKWAIEYEEPAGEAFNLNHPEASVFINNCNVILSAIMSACGDEDDCISTPEALEEAKKLDEKDINNLPRPGEVDFINGGPPCQGFSGMNRFNKSAWSKVQCEMILAFLSFADYFRPKYFLLENVRNFVSFNKGQTFQLTIASLLEMGYQVRFGILEAGAFGVSQSRKRAFIWAASPEETLPDWPEPMHVFAGPELKITLGRGTQYAAVRSTSSGAPFRSITVRDAIGDLPAVLNGASLASMEYKNEPVSWFQKMIRRDMVTLIDHISKEMNELNLIRCQKIPKRPGSDWRDLPEEKVKLSTGQMVDLVPWCLPNTAERHNQWKGLFGRLDWEGNFPTSITDPQPMGKVGMCFHPDQDRIVTVRECARSQGFPDSYKFAGNIQHRHRQIGNAVPPPLAFALGRKLKEAVDSKCSAEQAV